MTVAAAIVGAATMVKGLEGEAQACGGCFHPPAENDSVITDHRMIFSLSSEQTTLWDQIRWAGSPASFAWVLPVSDSKVATLGLSADVAFDALDSLTGTQVEPPPQNCPPPPNCGQGFGGGGSSSGGPLGVEDAGAAVHGVDVNKEEVVGPYDVAFLHSTDANALSQWLTDHGFVIPADVAPVVAAYVNAKYDFVVMKLVPGAGVNAMRPVRVTTPGAAPVLPLRMVAAGTGPIVSITLWVLGEGRWNPQNFGFFSIESQDITWDWKTSSSDFTKLRADKNAATNNTQWEVESSMPLYEQQLDSLIRNGGSPFGGSSSGGPGGFGYDAGSDYSPVDAVDAGPDGSSTPGETAEQVREDDIAALTAGMNTSNLTVTRIRTELAHASLANDLVLAAGDQTVLSNIRTPTKEANEPLCPVYSGCEIVGQAPRSQAGGQSAVATAVGPGNGKSSFSCASAHDASPSWIGFGVAGALTMLGIGARRRRHR
jgi:MYXO-CTERM domain-containing protein